MRSKILQTDYRSSYKERHKWKMYMRERRKKIKLGLLIPTPFNLKTKTKTGHYHRDYQRMARARVIEHYGGFCVCCGENTKEFLAIDHINNDGARHRKYTTRNIATWIIKNNFPKKFQLLCHNCNFAKGIYKICPHKIQKKYS